jgi:predicted TIM-barrel fold metal-dependent hydrolase
MHVFGPFDSFPLPGPASYALPDGDAKANRTALELMGFDHAVLVQPSVYQTDHAALLDALGRGGGKLRGVGSCAPHASLDHLRSLRRAGIVALRFVEMRTAQGTPYPGTQGIAAFDALADSMLECGMHAQLWSDTESALALSERTIAMGMPLVLDHLGWLGAGDGPATRRFAALTQLLESAHVWVKATYFRRSSLPGDYGDMRQVVSELVRVRPDRILWASDWPFVKLDRPAPDAGRLLDQFRDWVGEETFTRVLRDNPAGLFGFTD